MKNQLKVITALIAALVLNACATFKAQYDSESFKELNSDKKIAHSFYLIGDAGNIASNTNSNVLKMFESELNKASKNSTAIFLGDNIYIISKLKRLVKNNSYCTKDVCNTLLSG